MYLGGVCVCVSVCVHVPRTSGLAVESHLQSADGRARLPPPPPPPPCLLLLASVSHCRKEDEEVLEVRCR